ncbi:uncharacterized protein LOC113464183, partial [Ceratina calcarata]|uniref:Uncharacterized protein LOC113464183 n=1 Tax=Ceratina calcarata TaxID=156304 RepID=A0AAJ7RZ41_9HYME
MRRKILEHARLQYCSQNANNENSTRIIGDTQAVPSTSANPSSSFTAVCTHEEIVEDVDMPDAASICPPASEVECSISSNASKNSDDSLSSSFQPSFRERLASYIVDNNLTHAQGNNLLSLLRSEASSCPHVTMSSLLSLPKDVRTLLGTARGSIVISVVPPGEYIHFNVQSQILKELVNSSHVTYSNLTELQLDMHTDGCALDKSGYIHVWPIQCRIANLPNSRPIVLGIYKGKQEPSDPNGFFDKVITDIKLLISSGGITFNGYTIPITVRCFIADALGRAFILNHLGHVSYKPYSKCTIRGVQVQNRTVFNGVHHPL